MVLVVRATIMTCLLCCCSGDNSMNLAAGGSLRAKAEHARHTAQAMANAPDQ